MVSELAASQLSFYLFRDFRIKIGEKAVSGIEAQKPRELLCYLLLNRPRPFFREALITLLWEDTEPEAARKYFRQALWQLQHELRGLLGPAGEQLILVEADWIRVNEAKSVWSDVDRLQWVYDISRGISGYDLSEPQIRDLIAAADLYLGDLLEGWYQDWCLFERERLQNIYLMLLDKLMDSFEARRLYEDGIVYGMRILKMDYAREETHRRLMRLYYLAGDRIQALRQYELCLNVLDKELQVAPSQRTTQLKDAIRHDHGLPDTPASAQPGARQQLADDRIIPFLNRLQHRLAELNQHVSQDIGAMIGSLYDRE